MKIWHLASQISFGKYKGMSILVVIEADPQYIQWALDNIPDFALSSEAKTYFQERLREHEEERKIRFIPASKNRGQEDFQFGKD